jgi:hypothetical protein
VTTTPSGVAGQSSRARCQPEQERRDGSVEPPGAAEGSSRARVCASRGPSDRASNDSESDDSGTARSLGTRCRCGVSVLAERDAHQDAGCEQHDPERDRIHGITAARLRYGGRTQRASVCLAMEPRSISEALMSEMACPKAAATANGCAGSAARTSSHPSASRPEASRSASKRPKAARAPWPGRLTGRR